MSGDRGIWYFNNYFGTFTAEEQATAAPIYQIYYRNDFLLDLPSAATLPTAPTQALKHVPGNDSPTQGTSRAQLTQAYPFGYANQVLFGLNQVAYSSRYGGSVAFTFEQSAINGPNEPTTHPEDFEYEFAHALGNDVYRFDVRDLTMTVYVVPDSINFNPKSNQASFNSRPGIEFLIGDVVSYRNGRVVTSATADSLFRAVLDTVGVRVAAGFTGYRAAPNRFAHAWIHNQFQTLIGPNDRVTRILISDNWLDLFTLEYRPYVMVSWELTHLSMHDSDEADGFFQGSMDWIVNTKVTYERADGAEEAGVSKDWRFTGDHHNRSRTVAAFDPQECTSIGTIRVDISVAEEETLNADTDIGDATVGLSLNCSAITAQAARATYTGHVDLGVLPTFSGELLDCDDAPSPNLLDGSAFVDVCTDGAYLKGTTPVMQLGELGIPVIRANTAWRARVTIVAR